MIATGFTLHAQLASDTLEVAELALSRVLLMNDAGYPWLVLVPRRAGLVELTDLERDEHDALTGEIRAAMAVLKALFAPDKLNVAALGNVVPQLHVHVIARFRRDAAWPRPVWGVVPPIAYEERAAAERVAALRTAFERAAR